MVNWRVLVSLRALPGIFPGIFICTVAVFSLQKRASPRTSSPRRCGKGRRRRNRHILDDKIFRAAHPTIKPIISGCTRIEDCVAYWFQGFFRRTLNRGNARPFLSSNFKLTCSASIKTEMYKKQSLVTNALYGHHIKQSIDQPGKVGNPARGQRGKIIFSCPRSRLTIWSRGMVCPSHTLHTQANIVLTHGVPPDFGLHVF